MYPNAARGAVIACLATALSLAGAVTSVFGGERSYDFKLVATGSVLARENPKTTFPSVIRLPDWLDAEHRAHPNARYYLYYSTHHGDHILMKWAASLDGPWHEYNLGGRFNGFTRRGVFDVRSDPSRAAYGHIAAPDVHVDDEHRQFIMFFHGQNQPGTRTASGLTVPRHHESFVATSSNGLNFHDPQTAGGQTGHGPQTVTWEGVTRDVCIGPSYQRAFQHRGQWYSLSKRAVLSKALDPDHPFAPNPEHPFGMAWVQENTPSALWQQKVASVQKTYFSPIATFLASSEFAEHPRNPNPGTRILSGSERINHLSVCVLPEDRLEVIFYIKGDPEDRYPALYRMLHDISDPDFQNWDLVRDEAGQVRFEVLVSPEDIVAAVKQQHPNLKPMYHADPISLGTSCIFMDADGGKYLFFSYVSAEFSGDDGEGQIAAIRLIPRQ